MSNDENLLFSQPHLTKLNIMQVLTLNEIQQVSGAADWGQVGAGLAAVGVGITVAATPVGWIGAIGAGIFSAAGGYNIGRGMMKP